MKPGKLFRRFLGFGVLALLVALVVGIWLQWPWLAAEHDRLEPVHLILIWSGDAVSLIWLVGLTINHCLLARPFPNVGSRDPKTLFLLASLVVAFACDVAITAVSWHREVTGRRRAVVANGMIVSRRPSFNGELAYVTSRFQDRAGNWYECRHQLDLEGPGRLPRIHDEIRARNFPQPVQISYDPTWPPRSWIHGFNNNDDNRLHAMSIAMMVFQAMFIPLFLIQKWWRDMPHLLPFRSFVPLLAAMMPFHCATVGKLLLGEF